MEEEYKKEEKHVEFMMEIYQMQIDGGRYFLHEHPLTAKSWKMERVKQIEKEQGVMTRTADLCRYGMTTPVTRLSDGRRIQKPVKKPTKFMTNAEEVANEPSKRCQGGHSHEPLLSGKAKAAEKYPKELCEAICRGLVKQMKMDQMQVRPLMRITRFDEVGRVEGGDKKTCQEHEEFDLEEAYDDVTGMGLDPKEVTRARLKEMSYIDDKQVWRKISRREAKDRGIKTVGVRWIDINKGDTEKPDLRSRLVAKDFNTGQEGGLFAATPPLEALKLLISEAATIDER